MGRDTLRTPVSETTTSHLGRTVLIAGCVYAALPAPWCVAPLALAIGIGVGLWGGASAEKWPKVVSKYLIQVCVILLGLRIDLAELAKAAQDGWIIAIGSIVVTLGLGLLLGRWLGVERETSTLITSGTAICGGSAIVAVGASIGARPGAIAVATGAIFILNAVGLLLLPLIGRGLGLTPQEFGTWAGVALHDVASVGGAARAFAGTSGDGSAIDTANIVKLTRVVWIFPIALGFGFLAAKRQRAARADDNDPTLPATGPSPLPRLKSPFPWFIVGFLAASLLRTLMPELAVWAPNIKTVAASGFQIALFLIGTGLTREVLREVGWRAVVQATVLWLVVASGTLGVLWLMRIA